MNLFAYCHNNPVNCSDYTGCQPTPPHFRYPEGASNDFGNQFAAHSIEEGEEWGAYIIQHPNGGFIFVDPHTDHNPFGVNFPNIGEDANGNPIFTGPGPFHGALVVRAAHTHGAWALFTDDFFSGGDQQFVEDWQIPLDVFTPGGGHQALHPNHVPANHVEQRLFNNHGVLMGDPLAMNMPFDLDHPNAANIAQHGGRGIRRRNRLEDAGFVAINLDYFNY